MYGLMAVWEEIGGELALAFWQSKFKFNYSVVSPAVSMGYKILPSSGPPNLM